MSKTKGTTERYLGDGVPGTVTSIPLTDVDARTPADASIGTLVKDATTQLSTLVRAEVELAKAEVTKEVKRGLQGSIFFLLALAVLIFSSFFFFIFVAELLDLWVARWLSFLIVFLAMVLVTIIFAFLGYLRMKKIRVPEKTIESLKTTGTVLAATGQDATSSGRHAK